MTPDIETLLAEVREPANAYIREDECIGCKKCIKACPVDAILGGPKLMHTVITHECIGCNQCVAPCPVDCIDMIPTNNPEFNPDTARQRNQHQLQRFAQEAKEKKQKHDKARVLAKQAYIQAATARVKLKRTTA